MATTSPEKPSPDAGARLLVQGVGQVRGLAGAGFEHDFDVPSPDSFLTTSGTRATLRSPSAVSFGTESFIGGAGRLVNGAPGCLAALGRLPGARPGRPDAVMFFFSNRLGCAGSVLVSVVGTLLLLVLVGLVDL